MRLVLKDGTSHKINNNIAFYGFASIDMLNHEKSIMSKKEFDNGAPVAFSVPWETWDRVKDLNSYLSGETLVGGWLNGSYVQREAGVIAVNTFTSPKRKAYIESYVSSMFIPDIGYTRFQLGSKELDFLYNYDGTLIQNVKELSRLGSLILRVVSKSIPKGHLKVLEKYKFLNDLKGLVIYSPVYVFTDTHEFHFNQSWFDRGICLGFNLFGQPDKDMVIYISNPVNNKVEVSVGFFNAKTRQFINWEFGTVSIDLNNPDIITLTYDLEDYLVTLRKVVPRMLGNRSRGIRYFEGMAIL